MGRGKRINHIADDLEAVGERGTRPCCKGAEGKRLGRRRGERQPDFGSVARSGGQRFANDPALTHARRAKHDDASTIWVGKRTFDRLHLLGATGQGPSKTHANSVEGLARTVYAVYTMCS